jgi:queuine tRNA-ribosyltransferase
MQGNSFRIEKRGPGRARAGVISTAHGDIKTPAFTAVGTKATVKGLTPQQLADAGVQVLIANTYHLYLHPGEAVVEKMGGLHEFMNWQKPLMTDSGGFQIFSLGDGFGKKISKFTAEQASPLEGVTVYNDDLATSHGKLAIIDDEGVSFTSHLDGSLHRFTPERSVEIQHKLGADMFFAFDECTAPTASYEYQREAMERTHAWAKRSLTAHQHNTDARKRQWIYGIGQGGQFDDLRRLSAKTIGEMGFDGFGLGGSFSRKYGDNSLQSALAMLDELPPEMPIHGLGVGEPEDLLLAAAWGVDTFDCVTPTRNGRTGSVYTSDGRINVDGSAYVADKAPIDASCSCYTCRNFTRAYVCHLFRAKEMLGPVLASLHNMHFLVHLVDDIRTAILEDRLEAFSEAFLGRFLKRG